MKLYSVKYYITFMENSKKETIVEILKEFITVNPDSIIFFINR